VESQLLIIRAAPKAKPIEPEGLVRPRIASTTDVDQTSQYLLLSILQVLKYFYNLVTSTRFELVILCCIMANVLLMAVEFHNQPPL
jgi:hypothetical protein